MGDISDVTETNMDQSISVTFSVTGVIERNVSFTVSLILGGNGIITCRARETPLHVLSA